MMARATLRAQTVAFATGGAAVLLCVLALTALQLADLRRLSEGGLLLTAETRAVVAGCALASLLLGALWWLLAWLYAPVRQLTGRLAARAGTAPEPWRDLPGFSEVTDLQTQIHLLLDRQQQLGGFSYLAKRLSTSVSQVVAATERHGDLLDRQSAALQEAQVTAHQIRAMSTAAATSVNAVMTATDQAAQLGTTGEAALESSVGELTAIRAQVDAIAQQIAALGERTLQIGAVTATVKDIADQSSMLALNAAIEAVRAGQHGQGFSTVAHEIRSLADQSIEATQRVRELLEDIERATREAIRFTEQGVQRIDRGLQEVRQSGDTMRELSGLVQQNATAVRQIAASVGQQNAGISQLFEAIEDFGRMNADGITGLNATDEAAAEIERVSAEVGQALIEQ